MKLSQMRTLLDKKEISAVELTEKYLYDIEKKDKFLNSYITVCHERALTQAKAAQKLIDDGLASSLTGIPLSIKDNICTKDIRTTCASKMLEDFIPCYDASVIAKLKKEGAVILGKTNMDEFAMGSSSQTSYFGGVKNPYNINRIPGGSSGGAAASVSSGLCAAALGSDTGGSVRQPAAFCGVTGLNPTYGTVSRWGLIAFASSLDRIGVIGKCAEDTGYVLNCIGGEDEFDQTLSKTSCGNCLELVGSNFSSLKIGVPKEFFSDINDDVKSAVLSASEYYKSLGCEIYECSLSSLKYAVAAYYIISSAEAASNLSRFDGIKYGHRADGTSYEAVISKSRREGFGDEVKRRIMLGNYALSSGYYDEYYLKARKIRTQIRLEYDKIFEKCDVILTPTVPTTAPKIGTLEKEPVNMYLSDICTVASSIAGLPTISSVCGYDTKGMPIGMSLTGKAFDEKTIIALCDRFERDFAYKEAAI